MHVVKGAEGTYSLWVAMFVISSTIMIGGHVFINEVITFLHFLQNLFYLFSYAHYDLASTDDERQSGRRCESLVNGRR